MLLSFSLPSLWPFCSQFHPKLDLSSHLKMLLQALWLVSSELSSANFKVWKCLLLTSISGKFQQEPKPPLNHCLDFKNFSSKRTPLATFYGTNKSIFGWRAGRHCLKRRRSWQGRRSSAIKVSGSLAVSLPRRLRLLTLSVPSACLQDMTQDQTLTPILT